MSLISYLNYNFNQNVMILTCFAFISFVVANLDMNCSIGRSGDCSDDEICLQYNISQPFGRCVCRQPNNCLNNSILITTIKPLPIYSAEESSNSSVIMSSILGTVASIVIILMAYYFGVRKGVFRDIWSRTFTQRTVEHQLLDRNPQYDDNDTEAIA